MAAIGSALEKAGLDRTTLRTADLVPVDEFHIRGRAASLEIIEALGVTADAHVLDLGSGLGGPARTLAELTGCRVTGVDLTAEFCEVATALSEWTGLSLRTRFQVGDATATGLPDAAFDSPPVPTPDIDPEASLAALLHISKEDAAEVREQADEKADQRRK